MNISVAHRYVSMYCNVVRKKALAQWAGNGKIYILNERTAHK